MEKEITVNQKVVFLYFNCQECGAPLGGLQEDPLCEGCRLLAWFEDLEHDESREA